MRTNKFEISEFVCQECGKSFPLPRAKARRRKEGHVKDLWCPFCQKEVKTIEYRPRDFYKTLNGDIVNKTGRKIVWL